MIRLEELELSENDVGDVMTYLPTYTHLNG